MAAQGKLTLRNYRCFDWDNPAVLEFGGGFTAYVGANNSGKSSALRSIFELRNIFSNILTPFSPNSGFRLNIVPIGIVDITEVANDSSPSKFCLEIEINSSFLPADRTQLHATEVALEYDTQSQVLLAKSYTAIAPNGENIYFDETKIRQAKATGLGQVFTYPDNVVVDFSAILDFAVSLHQSKYFPAFRNAINEGAGNYYDLPVGTSLVTTWDSWKAGSWRAQKNAISQVEKEIASLLGFDTLQINADQSGKTLDIIIDGRPQKLHEVGAGVAQLIIVLAAALVSKPPYILIDEPELSLHPQLQLKFLTTLASYTQKGLLFSTHSISLARSGAQRIYAVKKIKNGLSQMHPFNDNAINYGEWLGELNYSSRVELGCEGLLLVEGPTDVLFFQEFLRKLGKDHKYLLMQLGGSSLIRGGVIPQLSELTRIIDPSKIRVFIDSEKKSAEEPLAEDRAAFISDCTSIGIQVHVSEWRATENYFEQKGLRKALNERHQPLGHFQKLKDSPAPWHKSQNWRIARETELDDIINTDLGKFLVSL